jgi:hypothetical protein
MERADRFWTSAARGVKRRRSRAAVAEQLPVRALRVDLGRAAALILAVVPFDQIGVDFGHGTKAGQIAGADRALQGTGEDLGKGQSPQPLAEGAGVAFAAFG